MSPITANGVLFYISHHARERAEEMCIPREVIEECLVDPDEITTNPRTSKYPGDRLWCRGGIALPTRSGCNAKERAVVTVLPRTQDEWVRASELSLLADDRELRQTDHLPTEARLIAEGRFRPSVAFRLAELREACEFAQAALRAKPNDRAARAHFERLRVQLAAALKEAA